jgi:hypothetical protein
MPTTFPLPQSGRHSSRDTAVHAVGGSDLVFSSQDLLWTSWYQHIGTNKVWKASVLGGTKIGCCLVIVPELWFLLQGVVELCLRAASLADPDHAAWRDNPSDPATRAAQEARSPCYQPMLQLLLAVMGHGDAPPPKVFPSAAPPAAAGGAAAAAGPPQPEEMAAGDLQSAQQAMLRTCARSSDQYLHHSLYRTLMDVPGAAGAGALLAMDPPHLEAYLRQEGGLGLLAPGGAAPPLNKRQVEHLQLLCRLHVQKER